MEINTKDLMGLRTKCALAHIMLDNPSVQNIVETLKGLKDPDRIVEVKAVFNGVEVDGQVLEDWLQFQYKGIIKHFEDKYSDVEAEVQKRVKAVQDEVQKEALDDFRKRFDVIKERIETLELSLDIASHDDKTFQVYQK